MSSLVSCSDSDNKSETVNSSSPDLTVNLAVKFRDTASIEESIAQTIIDNISDLAGMKASELNTENQKLIISLKNQQTLATNNIHELKLQLEQQLEHNENETYLMILNGMNESKLTLYLESIQVELSKNFTSKALRSTLEVSKKLREWANLLDHKPKNETKKANKSQ
jgi:hypothetical protein